MAISPSVGHYGWKRRKLDHRDRWFRFSPQIACQDLPVKADLTGSSPGTLDQGQLGSCVWNAIAWVLAYLTFQAQPARNFTWVSRLYGYWYTRQMEDGVAGDTGCDPRDAIKVLTSRGDCLETSWPYDISRFKQKPPARCDRLAKKSIVREYLWIDDNDRSAGIRSAIVNNKPVLFGCSVFAQIESEQAAATGDIEMPASDEQPVGGHEMVIIGYDFSRADKPYDFYRIQQSWGTGWGVTGRGTIPAEYVHSLDLTADLCVIEAAP